MKSKIHIVDNYIQNPTHPITVNLIGAGGTGSRVLTNLGFIHTALQELGKPGLFVSVYDPDVVSPSNIGRQPFNTREINMNKAQCLVTKNNNFFGVKWKAYPTYFPSTLKKMKINELANVTLTCTDNIVSRVNLGNLFDEIKLRKGNQPYANPLYWMDFGNGQFTGQVVLGTVYKTIEQSSSKYDTVGYLKSATEEFDYSTIKEGDSGPSCSQAEALLKQDLFINPSIAAEGCNLLWWLFHHRYITHRGFYKNLSNSKTKPILL